MKKIGQSGGASRWRVCYQRGLPRLVLNVFTSFPWELKYGGRFDLCPLLSSLSPLLSSLIPLLSSGLRCCCGGGGSRLPRPAGQTQRVSLLTTSDSIVLARPDWKKKNL